MDKTDSVQNCLHHLRDHHGRILKKPMPMISSGISLERPIVRVQTRQAIKTGLQLTVQLLRCVYQVAEIIWIWISDSKPQGMVEAAWSPVQKCRVVAKDRTQNSDTWTITPVESKLALIVAAFRPWRRPDESRWRHPCPNPRRASQVQNRQPIEFALQSARRCRG